MRQIVLAYEKDCLHCLRNMPPQYNMRWHIETAKEAIEVTRQIVQQNELPKKYLVLFVKRFKRFSKALYLYENQSINQSKPIKMVTNQQIYSFLCVTHTAINHDYFAKEAGVSKELIKKIIQTQKEFLLPESERSKDFKPYGEIKPSTALKIYEAMLKYGFTL